MGVARTHMKLTEVKFSFVTSLQALAIFFAAIKSQAVVEFVGHHGQSTARSTHIRSIPQRLSAFQPWLVSLQPQAHRRTPLDLPKAFFGALAYA